MARFFFSGYIELDNVDDEEDAEDMITAIRALRELDFELDEVEFIDD